MVKVKEMKQKQRGRALTELSWARAERLLASRYFLGGSSCPLPQACSLLGHADMQMPGSPAGAGMGPRMAGGQAAPVQSCSFCRLPGDDSGPSMPLPEETPAT